MKDPPSPQVWRHDAEVASQHRDWKPPQMPDAIYRFSVCSNPV